MTQQSSTTDETFDINKIPSSRETFGDPTLYETLQWHLYQCPDCFPDEEPPPFGVADNRHCAEYYEIAQEYSDYERDYIMKGNP